MRIVVFSDSHNNFFALKNIVAKQSAANVYIHLGDGERDFDSLVNVFPNKTMYNVRGNCDWSSLTPPNGILELCGKRIFYTHGHTFQVKSGLDRLREHAHNIGADIVLFGHTHIALKEYENGVYYMNPGSISRPLSGKPSYGIVDITGAGIAMNIVYT